LNLLIAQSRWQFQLGGTLQSKSIHESQILFETDGTFGESMLLWMNLLRTPKLYGYGKLRHGFSGELFNVGYLSNLYRPMMVT